MGMTNWPMTPLEKMMTQKQVTKLVQEGEYIAEVDVDLIITEDEWSPYLSLADAYKLDDVREALRQGDLDRAGRLARVFKLTPIAV
jgi:hypothetical protein